MMDLRQAISTTSIKKLKRCRSFHFRYLELCRAKNISPLREIRSKTHVNSLLEFCGDKLGVTDWLLVNDSLCNDLILQSIDVRMHKAGGHVLEQMDSEKKARLFKQKPVIYTKFIFTSFIGAITSCIELNKNLKVLHLEGLPLGGKYVEQLAKALSCNDSIKDISFARSTIKDAGCEAICSTVKYLDNVEKLNLSECDLTVNGAVHVAEMIKIQKISRYTEGWEQSLRYRDVNPETIPGLRAIILARNPNIGDNGLREIVEILKDDVWIKILDFENCGLTDISANAILDCLDVNIYVHEINVSNNPGISKFLQRSVREALGKDDDELTQPTHYERNLAGLPVGKGKTKQNVQQIEGLKAMEEQLKMLQEQLSLERILRKKAEVLNEKLNQRILAIEHELEQQTNAQIPEGYSVVKCDVLESIINERDEYKKIANSLEALPADVPVNGIRKMINIYGKPRPSVIIELNKNNEVHHNETLKVQPILTQVRKVKSELKYIDLTGQDKEVTSKSDQEFKDDINYNIKAQKIEKNIGDAASMEHKCNTPRVKNQNLENPNNILDKKRFHFDANDHGDGLDNIMEYKKTTVKKHDLACEMEKLSLSSRHSYLSGCEDAQSSESETLRNIKEPAPFKVFISRNRKPATFSTLKNGDQIKSPRALFLGCNS